MDMRATRWRTILLSVTLILVSAASAPAQQSEYAAMAGVDSVQTVFDFRVSDPEVALGHLDLIHSMLRSPSLRRAGGQPELVVVFIGPSVNLVSTDGAAGDPGARSAIGEKIAAMDADGVRFEICMTAAHAHDVSPESILPEIVQVENGWTSLIGYQHQGYAMIADF